MNTDATEASHMSREDHTPYGGVQTLVSMINRIGQFFESYPDRAEAIDGIANHVQKFWEPRMRRQLYAHLDAHAADSGLSDLVREAVLERRTVLEPRR
jgi:formate dehydrogenase subunit delta